MQKLLPLSYIDHWTQRPNGTREAFLDSGQIDTLLHFPLTPQYFAVKSMIIISPSLYEGSLFPHLLSPLSNRLFEEGHALHSLSFVFSLQHGKGHSFPHGINV